MGSSIAEAADHLRVGQLDMAEAKCREALTVDRRDPAALHLLGTLAHVRGQTELAFELISRAIVVDPTIGIFHADLGGLRYGSGQLAEAALSLDEAVRLAPDLIGAHIRLAAVRADQGHIEEASQAARCALQLASADADMFARLGATLLGAGALEMARACYERCLALAPDHVEAHAGLGLLLLSSGDFARGWAEYEWRWRSVGMAAPPQRDAPAWTGEPLDGQRLLLWAEQGLGDTLQFARYARMLVRRGASVILEVQPEVARLLRDSLPEVDVISRGDALPAYDLHAPLLSVANLVSTRLTTIPAEVPYLHAEAELVARWTKRFGPRDGRQRVGLVWAGNPIHTNDRRRSLDPSRLAALANVAKVEWYSVQKGTAKRPPFDIVDWTAELTDFSETAAMLMHLDLVITVDTSVAHLAGALGRPVWLLLAYGPEWRWLLNRTDSPWYPTARLFRQPSPGDWNAVVAQVAAELAHPPGTDRSPS